MEIKRGDIVYTNLDGAKGSEQGKNRVCVVLQNNIGNKYSPTTIIVPLTSQIKKLDQQNIQYCEINDIEVMQKKGFLEMPILEVNESIMNFSEAVKWVNNQ